MPRLARLVRGLAERFQAGHRRGLLLTLIAAVKLWERGEKATPEKVAEEASRILECSRGRVDWGVESIDASRAQELLEELVEMDILERVEGGYRPKRHDEGDPFAEIAEALAPILLRAV